MPPVPAIWAPMMRSAGVGPRQMRMRLAATASSTTAAKTRRASAILRTNALADAGFLPSDLAVHRLVDI
jgi:hypothetical protein